MGSMIDTLKVIIMAQIFFSIAITIFAHAVAIATPEALNYFGSYTDIGAQWNATSINNDLTSNLDTQQNIPIIEVGALVFYSGNILLDVLLNFLTAIPTMLTLLLRGIMNLLSINSDIWLYFQLFATTIVGALYVVGLIQFLVGVRSGRVV